MAELNVSKKSIKTLLSGMQNKKFIIPEYQRPYKWDIDKCDTLWNDIIDFHNTQTIESASPAQSEYFLGTIVFYETGNNKNNLEIIDGQQRITSLLLLLRAFYYKLESMTEDANVKGLKTQITPCIWDINEISQQVTDKSQIHILSKAVTDDYNHILLNILESGVANCNSDPYSKNYNYFLKQCSDYAELEPMKWQSLCVTILNKCIILPIECNTEDTALTIFSTLNDRGMPLSDSDIFKAKIYQSRKESDRPSFIEEWKQLTEQTENSDLSIDDIFRFHSHVLRSIDEIYEKEIGLRKFYMDKERLLNENLMKDLIEISSFWLEINNPSDNNEQFVSNKARKFIQCLQSYPNEYWKYPVTVFFLKNKTNKVFEQKLIEFLSQLITFLFLSFIKQPTVSAIKTPIYKACINIQKDRALDFEFNKLNITELKKEIAKFGTSKILRSLLLLHAYLNPAQKDIIDSRCEIEHILPKKWQDTNYNGWSIESAKEYLERLGNKVVFEKKLNIQAGNGYFLNKKKKYKNSKISDVLDLAKYNQPDWLPNDIEKRETVFINTLFNFFEETINTSK